MNLKADMQVARSGPASLQFPSTQLKELTAAIGEPDRGVEVLNHNRDEAPLVSERQDTT
jgi:hypothetical protein